MGKGAVFFLILFLPLLAHSQEGYTPDELKALNAFQAKAYSQALNFYQELLDTKLTPAELSIVHYNLGTVYLAEKNYSESLKNFQEALQGAGGINPLLIKNAETNLAITRIRQASQFMEKKDYDPDLVLDWLRSAEYDLQGAQKAACEEDAREGYPGCLPNPVFKQIATAIGELRDKLPRGIKYQTMPPALAFLQAAIYAWQTKQPALADAFLQLALQNAKNKEEMNAFLQKATPENMLRHLIYQQRELQQIGMQVRSDSNLPQSFVTAMAQIQNAFNASAREFYPLVYKTQNSLFHAPASPEGLEDDRCQKVPWDSVLPEFQLGLTDADKASDALNIDRIQVAITNEETSSAYWEQALAYLLNPPKKAPEEQQTQQKPQGPQPKQPSESFQNILLNLQEMNRNLTAPPTTQGINIQKVEKPW